MRTFLLAVSTLITSACATSATISDFDNTFNEGPDGQTIAFVGEKIDVVQADYICPENHICMDAKFNARYRVIQLLAGDYTGEKIDFVVFDHYGLPRFSRYDRVVLYLQQFDGELYHHKYQFDALHPVKDGGYATCGDPYEDYEADELSRYGRHDPTVFEFEPAVTFKIADHLGYWEEDYDEVRPERIREDFIETMAQFAPPAFTIKNGVAKCRMGMTPSEVAAIRMKFDYSSQSSDTN